MITLYLVIILLLCWGASIQRNGFYADYCNKSQSCCIKGFFILVVFSRHVWPYLAEKGYSFSAFGDQIFRYIDSRLGQLLVVMFLFYSGYGVMESIKKKGVGYVKMMPIRRIFVTLANFDIAVLLFMITDILLGIDYPLSEVILAFSGWKSIGNSNWYIFVILCCYMSTYLAYFISSKTDRNVLGGGNIIDSN